MSMRKISTVTVPSGGQAAIEFTSIPSGFTDLLLVVSGRSTGTSSNYYTFTINGSTSTFTDRGLFGTGSSSGTFTTPGNFGGEIATSASTANTFGNTMVYFPNYAGSTNKSFFGDGVGENNATAAFQSIYGGIWATTSAITSIALYPNSANFAQYSSATLYGVTKGSLAGVTVS